MGKKTTIFLTIILAATFAVLFRRYIPYFNTAMVLVGLDSILPTDVTLVELVRGNPQLSLTTIGASTTAIGALSKFAVSKKNEVEQVTQNLTAQVNEAQMNISSLVDTVDKQEVSFKNTITEVTNKASEEKTSLLGQINAMTNQHREELNVVAREKDEWQNKYLTLQRTAEEQTKELETVKQESETSISNLENTRIAETSILEEKLKETQSNLETTTNLHSTALDGAKMSLLASFTTLKSTQITKLSSLKSEYDALVTNFQTDAPDLTGEQAQEIVKRKEDLTSEIQQLEREISGTEGQIKSVTETEVP